MFGKVKLKTAEIIFIVLAILVAVFVCGFFAGRGGTSKNVTVRVSDDIPVNEAVSFSDKDAVESETRSVPSAEKININEADEELLATLPSIGDVLSGRIVEYRTANGDFVRPEDIMNVYGIGSSIYEKIRDRITV